LSLRKSSAIALRALRRNRLQTILTTIGMTIGVGTVLAMVAIGSGAQKSITSQVRAAGMNTILISAGNWKAQQQWTSIGEAAEPAAWHPGKDSQQRLFNDGVLRDLARPQLRRMQDDMPPLPKIHFGNPTQQLEAGPENLQGAGGSHTLSLNDAADIAKLHGVQAASGGVHDNAQVLGGDNLWVTQIRGEQPSLTEIHHAWTMPRGRFFTQSEDDSLARVAVLGSVVSQHLFGVKNPVGEMLTLRGQSFKVIGVIASNSWMVPAATGDGQFDAVYIPVHTAQKLLARPYLDTITVTAASTGDVTRLIKMITYELRKLHHLDEATAPDFTVASQAHTAMTKGGLRTDFSRAMMSNTAGLDHVTLSQLSKTLERASRTMTVLLGSIAAVSLIVGGIGIMNIMLLSVTERTREIGIRRSVGAKSHEVMQQFLLEAVILSIGGGVLGILLGAGTSVMVARLIRWSTELSWISVLVSFTISAAIGILFGYYPARQASRVTPMTAMRFE
jgi:putative ABC transport system permease protein